MRTAWTYCGLRGREKQHVYHYLALDTKRIHCIGGAIRNSSSVCKLYQMMHIWKSGAQCSCLNVLSLGWWWWWWWCYSFIMLQLPLFPTNTRNKIILCVKPHLQICSLIYSIPWERRAMKTSPETHMSLRTPESPASLTTMNSLSLPSFSS